MKKFIFTIALVNILIVSSFCQDTLKAVLVKDIMQNSSPNFSENSSWPRNFCVLPDKIMFIASSVQIPNFYELWASDGTNEGTQLIQDVNNTSMNVIDGLIVWGNKIIFTANDGYHGYEPWISDGTPANTRMITDIMPNNPIYQSVYSSEARYFKVFKDKVYFQADTWGGRQLFVTDGTEAGTVMLTKGTGGTEPRGFIEFNGKLYFTCQKSYTSVPQLWVTDGTVDGTYEIKEIVNGYVSTYSAIVYNNKLYFSGLVESLGWELWVSDGTNPGTQLFKDINVTEGIGSHPHGFKIFKDNLYFIANDGIHGNELWCTNGDSTYLVKDIFLDGGGLEYSELYVFQNKLFFVARQNVNVLNSQLWVSNGTADSTLEILSNDGKEIEYANSFIEWKGKIVFVAGEYNKQLWMTDGTSQNTFPVFPDSKTRWNALGNNSLIVNFKDDLYFNANYNDSIGCELYKLKADSSLIRPNISQHPISNNICIGDSAFFEVKVSGRPDFKFQWMKNDIPIKNATEATYKIENASIEDSGSYSCFIKNSVGEITTNSASLEVYEISSLFEVIDSTQHGFYFIKFTGSAPTSAVYDWDFDEGEILSGAGQGPYHVAWKNSGQKNVTLNIIHNTCASETSKTAEIISTGNIVGTIVSVYPNPVKSYLTLNFNQSAEVKKVSVFDVYGRIKLEKQTNEIILNLNLSKLSSGLYYVRVQDNASFITKKFIKE
jgi:ELWxxDGT repeat protein